MYAQWEDWSQLAVICGQLVCRRLQRWPRNSRNLVSILYPYYHTAVRPHAGQLPGKNKGWITHNYDHILSTRITMSCCKQFAKSAHRTTIIIILGLQITETK